MLLLIYIYHANPTGMNNSFQTAIKVATHNGHRHIVRLLETAVTD